jgi:hypothetical protein
MVVERREGATSKIDWTPALKRILSLSIRTASEATQDKLLPKDRVIHKFCSGDFPT